MLYRFFNTKHQEEKLLLLLTSYFKVKYDWIFCTSPYEHCVFDLFRNNQFGSLLLKRTAIHYSHIQIATSKDLTVLVNQKQKYMLTDFDGHISV